MGLRSISPPVLASVRFTLASVLLLGIVLPFKRIRGQILTLGPWRIFILIGFLGTTLPSLFQNYGMVHLTAGISGVIQGAGPIYTALFAAYLLGEALGVRKIVGAAMAFSGTVLLSIVFKGGGTGSVLGITLLTLSAVTYSLYTVFVRKALLDRMNPMALLTGATLCGSLPLLFFTAIVEPVEQMISFNPSEMALISVLAVFSTVIAYACYVGALQRLEASKAAAFLFLIPVCALFFGFVFLGESISQLESIFSALIIIGVVVAESGR